MYMYIPSEMCDVCTHSSSAAIAAESSEVAMERQRRNQETIAEEMVDIARKLKHSAQTAKNIITSDTKVCLCICSGGDLAHFLSSADINRN